MEIWGRIGPLQGDAGWTDNRRVTICNPFLLSGAPESALSAAVSLDRASKPGYTRLQEVSMFIRRAFPLLFGAACLPVWCGDWNPKLAEQYLDSRQKAWVAWPTAMASGVACVSCHTGLPYLVARPALRHALNETNGPTLYEGLLLSSM